MVDTTVWYFLNMEEACKSQLLAEAVGEPFLYHMKQPALLEITLPMIYLHLQACSQC